MTQAWQNEGNMQITFDVGLKYANIMILAAVLDVLNK
jgi:hypothetical protein